jgi:hypothetical protein
VTPFDPAALVAMLRSFYPAPSGAAFVRARGERPEYFAGGTIFGSKSDKLRLPDGREFDCIVAAGGPAAGRAWQCALIDPNAPGAADPFPLEPGALEPIDEDMVIFPGGEPPLEGIVAADLSGLDGADGILEAGAADVAAFDGATVLDDTYRDLVEPAAEHHAGVRAALDADDPADVIDATNSHDGEISSGQDDYVEEEPPLIDLPEPGRPPRDGEDPGPPPK